MKKFFGPTNVIKVGSMEMGLDRRKGAGPPPSYDTQSLLHVVAMVTVVAVF